MRNEELLLEKVEDRCFKGCQRKIETTRSAPKDPFLERIGK